MDRYIYIDDSKEQILYKVGKSLYKKSNVYWSKLKIGKKKFYTTHNNGGRPLLIIVNKDTIDVYLNICADVCTDENSIWQYMRTIKYKKIFIGESPATAMTRFSGGYGKKFDGNTILLHIMKDVYAFIQTDVLLFKTNNEKITKYVSQVGNNDVPYPYAISDKNHYIIIEEKIIPNEEVVGDPIDYFYNLDKKRAKTLKTIKMKPVLGIVNQPYKLKK